MIKRSAAIAGVVLALGATAAVAIAIWPERAGEGGSTSTGQPPVGSAAGRAGGLGGGAYLGVDTRDITPDRLSELKLKEEHGVEVTLVDQDAPAGKAGLKEHDVILNLNGSQVESVEQLRRMIREIPPGRLVTLGISRDGQPMTVKAQLADRKKTFGMGMSGGKAFSFTMPAIPAIPATPVMPAMPEMDVPVSIVVVHSSARSGLMVENLTPQLGDFFGTKNGQGVLVRSVEKGSRAEKAGFRAGDVVVKVNDEAIHDTSDFTHAVRGRKIVTIEGIAKADGTGSRLLADATYGTYVVGESWSPDGRQILLPQSKRAGRCAGRRQQRSPSASGREPHRAADVVARRQPARLRVVRPQEADRRRARRGVHPAPVGRDDREPGRRVGRLRRPGRGRRAPRGCDRGARCRDPAVRGSARLRERRHLRPRSPSA